MRLTPKDIREKKLRQQSTPNKKERRRRVTRSKHCIDSQLYPEETPVGLWWEIAAALGHQDFLTIKMSGQTAKYTQSPEDVEWFRDLAPRKIAAELTRHFDATPMDIVLLSEGDKRVDSKVHGCAQSGIAETIHQTMLLVQRHMDKKRDELRVRFSCMIWGASNHDTSKYESIFGEGRVLGSSQRAFITPPDISRVWPGVEKCRALKYAGSHFEAAQAADMTFRVEGSRALTDTALSYYGPRRCGYDHFIRPTQPLIAQALRYLSHRNCSCA